MAARANGADSEEVCPVCKTSSYLNKGIRFLINPECYHRILNRREDEFETKRDWDDFLEQREEIITNLVSRTNVAETEKQLQEYAASNESSIKANSRLEREESDSFRRRQVEEDQLAKTRREASKRAQGDERQARLDERAKILDQMAAGQYDPDRYKAAAKKQVTRPQPSASTGGLKIKGIKARPAPESLLDKQYDPFMGLPITRDYYTLQDDYPSAKLSKAKNDPRVMIGGYDFKAFYDESLLKAFAGLTCFIGEEVGARDAITTKAVATAVAANV
ncbi:putative cdk-activating kinase assembly factor mat1 [Phaeomoniella chlamydospora]|uniref:Putative cdk-activating kinase assembly factor mat1 n=1 Tax=Phaeomoniella chlamydospora TaxID=158046 RepID=A0A0G2E6M1_PHACM|nr:putative cdk-activating kinase assembly factor mat1 [Phaeomoniella chlamydospora]